MCIFTGDYEYYFVQLVWNRFSMNDREIRFIFDSERSNITQMWQLFKDYVYSIIIDIKLWFSVRLLITYAWNCHFLCVAFSWKQCWSVGNVCLLTLSFIYSMMGLLICKYVLLTRGQCIVSDIQMTVGFLPKIQH